MKGSFNQMVINHLKKSTPEQSSLDKQRVERIKVGDSTAFKELFCAYCQPLIRFALRFVNDVTTAEDVVQDIFLKIWLNRQQLNPTLNIKSYLYVAVKNQALKQRRQQGVRSQGNMIMHLSHQYIPTPEETLNTKEIETTVFQAIKELPDKCRLIFSMNRFDGLTYAEIAEILDLSIKTIETQMGRALKHLRDKLDQYL